MAENDWSMEMKLLDSRKEEAGKYADIKKTWHKFHIKIIELRI